nr:MAG: hypothetical protein [Bacteriophage sp.]
MDQKQGQKADASGQGVDFFSIGSELSALVTELNAGSKLEMAFEANTIWIGAAVLMLDVQRRTTGSAEF